MPFGRRRSVCACVRARARRPVLRVPGSGAEWNVDALDVSGLNKTSPRMFYAHDSSAISAAAAHESLILESAAAGLSSALLATP